MQTASSLAKQESNQVESEPVFILTSGQLQAFISKAVGESTRSLQESISHLQDTVAGQEARIGRLQQFVEIVYGDIPDPAHLLEFKENYKKQRDKFWDVVIRTGVLEDTIDNDMVPIIKIHDIAIKKLQTGPSSLSVGKTTGKRIAEIEKHLKENGGSMSFKSLRAKMELEANQFNRLLNALDKRKFEIVPNPRAKKEKILRLKVRFS